MMENKRESLAAVVLKWVVGLLRRLGGSAAVTRRRSDGELSGGKAGPVGPMYDPKCPDPAHCP